MRRRPPLRLATAATNDLVRTAQLSSTVDRCIEVLNKAAQQMASFVYTMQRRAHSDTHAHIETCRRQELQTAKIACAYLLNVLSMIMDMVKLLDELVNNRLLQGNGTFGTEEVERVEGAQGAQGVDCVEMPAPIIDPPLPPRTMLARAQTLINSFKRLATPRSVSTAR